MDVEFTKNLKKTMADIEWSDQMKRLEFLNAQQADLVASMTAKMDGLECLLNGGFIGADRKRAVLYPPYMELNEDAAKIDLFEVEVIGNGQLTHSQILGSLMGLNISRGVIGDIVVDNNKAYFAAMTEFRQFILENVSQMGPNYVRLKLVETPIKRQLNVEEMEIIVSSMRLDVVVKAIINAARTKAGDYLEAGFVRHNHEVEKKPDKACRIGDIISIRKHGRYKIAAEKKRTKSDKYVLVIEKSV